MGIIIESIKIRKLKYWRFYMKKFNLAILGPMGSVGQEILKILNERNLPINQLKLLATKKYEGIEIVICGNKYTVEEITDESFNYIDILFMAVSAETSKIYTPIAVRKGVFVIDNSSAYRMDVDVPLVIPEINPDDIMENKGIIANPNCSTIIALTALNELNKFSPITKIIASTYQAVSGAGKEGVLELEEQMGKHVNGLEITPKIFTSRILHNVIPHIDNFTDNGYTLEEMKMVNESKKILHNDSIEITCTSVRVPVLRSHSISIFIETKEPILVDKAKELLSNTEGVRLMDDIDNMIYPTPLESTDKDDIFVGRVRKDIRSNGLNLWCCGDQIRKGAATNAVQIAELLISKTLHSREC
jgi:aspartate-semialdehyde dehydrogenase